MTGVSYVCAFGYSGILSTVHFVRSRSPELPKMVRKRIYLKVPAGQPLLSKAFQYNSLPPPDLSFYLSLPLCDKPLLQKRFSSFSLKSSCTDGTWNEDGGWVLDCM